MGFMDEAKELAEKAKDLASGHEDQAKAALDKAGDLIDEKTGDKYKDQVDKGQEFVGEKLGLDEDK
jgi:hypothetical protein